MESLKQELLRVRYPHMVKDEIEEWKRFLKEHGNEFTDFKYDIRVGKGIGNLPGIGTQYQHMATYLSQKRIDVVGYKQNNRYIIELKQSAYEGALGQLLGYKILYEDRYGKGTVQGLILVCTRADNDIIRSASVQGIQVIII